MSIVIKNSYLFVIDNLMSFKVVLLFKRHPVMCFIKIINWKNSYLFNVDILLSYPASAKDSKISILNKNMRFFIKCVYIFIKFLHPLSVAEVRFLKELIVFGKERMFMFSREKFFVVKLCTNSCSWEKCFIKLDGKLLSFSKYILI